MSSILKPGEKQAKRAAALSEQRIGEQKQKEQLRLAEAESDIAKRRAGATTGARGRSSLIATSPAGVTGTLGGS